METNREGNKKMKLLKKATKIEKYGNAQCQRTMQKLKEKYNIEVVYMPYGIEGSGFYCEEVIQ